MRIDPATAPSCAVHYAYVVLVGRGVKKGTDRDRGEGGDNMNGMNLFCTPACRELHES